MLNLLGSFAGIMNIVLGIALALLLFALLVFVHELGHYIAGKIFKFKINEFSLGFGKAIYSKKKSNGEVFSIRLIPLGGYCAFEGEEGNSEVEGAFNKQAWWKRLIVLFAGVLFNFVSAIIVSIPLLMVMGNAIPVITDFKANTPNHIEYDLSTLQKGDIIREVEGVKPTYTNGGIVLLCRQQQDSSYTLTIERNGDLCEIEVTNILLGQDKDGKDVYGLGVDYDYIKYNFFEALVMSTPFCFEMSGDCIRIIGNLFIGKTQLSDLGGPVTTIGTIAGSITAAGSVGLVLLNMLLLFPVLAINLAVFNFLPFPALDGGRAVFVILEGIRRKPINPKIESIIHSAGLIILFAFVILVDLLQIFIY